MISHIKASVHGIVGGLSKVAVAPTTIEFINAQNSD